MSVLSDLEIVLYEVKAGFPLNPRVLAEGVGIVRAESGGNPKSEVPGNEHIGMWAESSAFGTRAQRLDPMASTVAARKEWEKDGKSFYPAWGRWEAEQSGRDGATTWKEHLAAAKQVLMGGPVKGGGEGRGSAFKAKRSPAEGDSPSGFMVFLISAALILGGVALVGLGMMRAVGVDRGKTGLEAAA